LLRDAPELRNFVSLQTQELDVLREIFLRDPGTPRHDPDIVAFLAADDRL
jgi:hypothetical protein